MSLTNKWQQWGVPVESGLADFPLSSQTKDPSKYDVKKKCDIPFIWVFFIFGHFFSAFLWWTVKKQTGTKGRDSLPAGIKLATVTLRCHVSARKLPFNYGLLSKTRDFRLVSPHVTLVRCCTFLKRLSYGLMCQSKTAWNDAVQEDGEKDEGFLCKN